MKTLMRPAAKATTQRPVFVTVKERLARLAKMDLTRINAKVRRELGWSEPQANEAEKWYRRFLECIIRFPKHAKYVPNGPIDEFWHSHICDTRAYGPDCEHVVGHFVHHNPYFGVNGDAAARDSWFEQTNALYRREFGEDCTQMATFANTAMGDCAVNCHNG